MTPSEARPPVAVVTGAASGVGAASVRALAARGALVAVCDINPAGKEIAEACGGLFVTLDVSDPDSWAAAVELITARLGPVEIAHLNAGVMTASPDEPIETAMNLSQVGVDRYDRIVGVNLGGVVHGLRSLWGPMTAQGRGAIVATASAAGLGGYPFDPLYSATKHAVVGLIRSTAPVLRARGVRVQAICPGGIDTPLLPDYGRASGLPMLRPDQVAAAIADLLLVEREGTVFTITHDRPEAVLVADPVVDF